MNKTLKAGTDIETSVGGRTVVSVRKAAAVRASDLWEHMGMGAPSNGASVQESFDDLGTPLSDAVFTVVDLETTGGSPKSDAITEIGAVKVRGGEVLGEFQTLVRPSEPINPRIVALTGISNGMVASAPPIESVLPSFMEFARGSLLVAHNARFDETFLRSTARRHNYQWEFPRFVDTLTLARRVLTRSDVPNYRLGTLASHLGATTTPDHRALSDARATVDVLHALIARLSAFGITEVEDLDALTRPVPAEVMRKRHLADGLPTKPGVYIFEDAQGAALYVGSSGNIRSRVRTYFTASENRSRMAEMVRIATHVRSVQCATLLEARIRELRLITELSPRYNRRSTRQLSLAWVRLTDEPHPRLSAVRNVDSLDPSAPVLGPFTSMSSARSALQAIHTVLPIRRCTKRLPETPKDDSSVCVQFDLGNCAAPCMTSSSPIENETIINHVVDALGANPMPVMEHLSERLAMLSDAQRFEEAGECRDALLAYVRGLKRSRRVTPIVRCEQIVAATPRLRGGWEILVIRHGQFAGTAICAGGRDPMPIVESLLACADDVPVGSDPLHGARLEELELLIHALEQPGTRLIDIDGDWCEPTLGGAQLARFTATTSRSMPTTVSETTMGSKGYSTTASASDQDASQAS